MNSDLVAASYFFVGLGAGLALLTVPILVLGPGMDVPDRVAAWVNGPPPQVEQSVASLPSVNRPVRGFVRGEPTPGPDAPPPTLRPRRSTRLARHRQRPRPVRSSHSRNRRLWLHCSRMGSGPA